VNACRIVAAEAEGGVSEAVEALRTGGVIAFPTDTLYGLGCIWMRPRAVERIANMRGIDARRRPFTLLLPDIGEVARFADVSAPMHRVLERITPGPYCVELPATDAVPDPFVVGRRRTIGVRVPDHAVCEKLLWQVGYPVVSVTAKAPDGRLLTTAAEIAAAFPDDLDLVLDGGRLDGPPSTVVSLMDDWITVLRQGKGNTHKLII